MSTFTENGLNVQYVSNFIEKSKADRYLKQLKLLPFYTPTFKIRGKCIQPKRLVLGYGDPHLSYDFSGTSIPALDWTPLMLELRDQVEKFTACTFNFVLLNLYPSGSSCLSQHKDIEDSVFPIAVLSFGAERTIEFKRPDTPSTFIKLQHGSLYTMLDPTNKLFTHGIAPEPEVKDITISLTFRHLIGLDETSKKPRLDTPTCETIPDRDWLTDLYQQSLTVIPVLKEWNLNWNTLLQVIMDEQFNVRIHIRVFNETKTGQLLPSRQGVVLTPVSWCDFQNKLRKVNFQSTSDSFIANNQLVFMCIDEDFAVLQQVFPMNSVGYFLKPTALKLSKDQCLNLCELSPKITEFLINALFTMYLPKMILSRSPVCHSHLNFEDAKQNLLNILCSEIISCTYDIIHCEACKTISHNQENHVCIKPVFENYCLEKNNILLQLNWTKIIDNLFSTCVCHYDILFFKELTVDYYMTHLEEMLLKYKDTYV